MKKDLIVVLANQLFQSKKRSKIDFTGNEEANILLNDLDNYPHAFVLACLMDRQIKAEKAWVIPYKVFKFLNTNNIHELSKINLIDYKNIFKNNNFHRFNDIMSSVFHDAVIDIVHKYNGDASNIWNNKPSSASVVYKFLEFNGGGIKISTMAANILSRQFKIEFSDLYSIDISPDVHIIRVMKRMGYIPINANAEMVIYKARELNPEFPGIIDFSCWEIGRKWCRPNKPDCVNCKVTSECKKAIVNDA